MSIAIAVPGDGGTMSPPPLARIERLRLVAERRFDLSISTATGFFEENAERISAAALQMAERFSRGGRLLVFGDGADATDAAHVAVEFVHPVIVGKRALPAIALSNDVATVTSGGSAIAGRGAYAAMLGTLGRPADIALAIGEPDAPRIVRAIEEARSLGMLTVSIARGSASSGQHGSTDHAFRLPTDDVLVAQEVGETLYHVFWELVHLFLEHGVGAAGTTAPVPGCVPTAEGSCSICADEGLPGVVMSLSPIDRTAEVQVAGQTQTVALDLIDDAAPGDWVLVHMGFAIGRITGPQL